MKTLSQYYSDITVLLAQLSSSYSEVNEKESHTDDRGDMWPATLGKPPVQSRKKCCLVPANGCKDSSRPQIVSHKFFCLCLGDSNKGVDELFLDILQ